MKPQDILAIAALAVLTFWVGQSGNNVPPVMTGEALAASSAVASLSASEREATKIFERELADHLRRGIQSFEDLPALWERASRHHAAMARAVGQVGTRDGLRFLGGVVGEGEPEEAILIEIGRLAPLADYELAREVAEPLREILRASTDATIVRLTVLALGRLEDEDSITLLIDLLPESPKSPPTYVARTLTAITGESFGDHADRWQAWYDREKAWFDENGAELFAELESKNDNEVFSAVSELSNVGLWRHRTAKAMLPLLEHESRSIRRLVCQSLGQLGSSIAVTRLVELLGDADAEVARSAWIALRWLTGLDLPQDPETWEEAVDATLS